MYVHLILSKKKKNKHGHAHCMCSYHTSLKSLFLFTMTFKKMSRKCYKSFQIDSVHALELTIKINIS